MIAAIIIAAVGALLILLAVFLRKKLGRSWTISFLAAGILTALAGGVFTGQQWQQEQQRRESIYLGLRYLEQSETESCAYYLKQAGTADSFAAAAARSLLDLVRGNELSTRLDLSLAETSARSQEEKDFLAVLPSVAVQDPNQLAAAVSRIAGFLDLSGRQTARLDAYIQMESNGGYDPLAEENLDQNAADRLRISQMLHYGSYEAAVSEAVRLTDRTPSEDNRLLLAETVAESAYNGLILSGGAFLANGGEPDAVPKEDPTVRKERQKLDSQREALEVQLADLELLNNGQEEGTQQRILELTEEIQTLRTRSDKLYVYRAFNAIADLHSTEAALVRARLYFALQDYQQALDTLRDTAGSLRTRLSPDRELGTALQAVERAYDAYEKGDTFQESQEFQDMLVILLSKPFPDLMYLSQTNLTQGFAQHIISDLKVYGKSLFVTQLDTSGFPKIRVTLSGRETLLRKIAGQTDTQCRDTRQDVTYTASLQTAALSNVCVVVDRSGSMDGQPMEDLKEALTNFINGSPEEGMLTSLVAFESDAETLSELTQDRALLLNQVNGLGGGGGTEITAGIREGTASLENAVGGKVMLLMTDGQSDVDFNVVEEAAAAGITIHTIGFGSVNDALLREIADRTGGQYIKADSSQELSNVYASLQQIIGQTLVLEYTAPEADTDQSRYFFLRTEKYSVRVDYDPASLSAPAAFVTYCYPQWFSANDLQDMTERNRTVSLELRGELLNTVAAVTVGGLTAQVDQQEEDRISLTLPPQLQQGWQSVTLSLEEGETVSYDRLLYVGEPVRIPALRLGCLSTSPVWGFLPGDGTLVLADSGIRLTENRSEEDSSLRLYMTGTLEFPVTAAQQEQILGAGYNDEVDLGSQGVITGWGEIRLDSSDSAYTDGAPGTLVRGAVQFDCEADQARLSAREGEG